MATITKELVKLCRVFCKLAHEESSKHMTTEDHINLRGIDPMECDSLIGLALEEGEIDQDTADYLCDVARHADPKTLAIEACRIMNSSSNYISALAGLFAVGAEHGLSYDELVRIAPKWWG